MSKKKDNVSNETIKNENLENENVDVAGDESNENVDNENKLNENQSGEENNAENSQPDETYGEEDNVSNETNDFKDKIQNTSIERIKVVAKYNNGSFDKGCEYEISKKVFDQYNGLFEILE